MWCQTQDLNPCDREGRVDNHNIQFSVQGFKILVNK